MAMTARLADTGVSMDHAKRSAVCACDTASRVCAPINDAARRGNWRSLSAQLDNKSDLFALARLQTNQEDLVTQLLLQQHLANRLVEAG